MAGLEKRYRTGLLGGSRAALRDVGFRLDQGEGLALIGPNGAGKSTLLLVLAGLRRPTAGTVRVMGRSPSEPGVRGVIGLLPERPVLHRNVTVRSALVTWAELQGYPRADAVEEVRLVLDRLHLGPWADQATDRLSQGLRQRVALARALQHRPELLLLDEPLANLDPESARIVLDVLLEERERGVALLVASHRVTDLASVCDGVAAMQEGVLRALGPLDEVLAGLPSRVSYRLPGGAVDPELGTPLAARGGLRVRSVPPDRREPLLQAIRDAGGTVVRVEPVVEGLA